MPTRTVVLLLFLLIFTAAWSACGREATPTSTPAPSPTASPGGVASPTPVGTPTSTPAPARPTATPTRAPTPTPTPTAAATPTSTPRPAFFLRVLSPQHEAVVTTATVQVTGETTPDAAVSVNGQFVEVDSSGRFQSTVTLVPGPNFVEVLASDFTGRRASAEVLTLLYVP